MSVVLPPDIRGPPDINDPHEGPWWRLSDYHRPWTEADLYPSRGIYDCVSCAVVLQRPMTEEDELAQALALSVEDIPQPHASTSAGASQGTPAADPPTAPFPAQPTGNGVNEREDASGTANGACSQVPFDSTQVATTLFLCRCQHCKQDRDTARSQGCCPIYAAGKLYLSAHSGATPMLIPKQEVCHLSVTAELS